MNPIAPHPTRHPTRRRAALGRLKRRLAAGLALGLAVPALAVAAAEAAPFGHATVQDALAALQARDGVDAVVTHQDGWTVVAEPGASTQWSFTPTGHAAHPAVVRRIVQRQPDGRVRVDVQAWCPQAPEAACDALRRQFEQMNERIRQAVGTRGRPAPPAVPAAGGEPPPAAR